MRERANHASNIVTNATRLASQRLAVRPVCMCVYGCMWKHYVYVCGYIYTWRGSVLTTPSKIVTNATHFVCQFGDDARHQRQHRYQRRTPCLAQFGGNARHQRVGGVWRWWGCSSRTRGWYSSRTPHVMLVTNATQACGVGEDARHERHTPCLQRRGEEIKWGHRGKRQERQERDKRDKRETRERRERDERETREDERETRERQERDKRETRGTQEGHKREIGRQETWNKRDKRHERDKRETRETDNFVSQCSPSAWYVCVCIMETCMYVYTGKRCMRVCMYAWCGSAHISHRVSVCVRSTTHMGWLQLVGFLKLQVSFAEYSLFYRALLQKRRKIVRSPIIEATPYRYVCAQQHISVCVRSTTHIDTGWLQLVGSLKLQVSFEEYRFFYRALLQKRRIILRSLLIIATPHVCAQRHISIWGGYDQ